MAADESQEGSTPLGNVEGEIKELLGLFDTPAFVRRGSDLESAIRRLREHLRRDRLAKLDMVHLRLKQWAKSATGPDDFRDVFRAPIFPWYALAGAESPQWASLPASPRSRRAVANDLIKSVERFNTRWAETLNAIRLEPINRQIDNYNRYYVLEKECVLGSARLAARHFVPKTPLTLDELIEEFPYLSQPERA